MGDSPHHWQPMLKENLFSSQMILTFIGTDPSSSQTPAKDTTECKRLFTHIDIYIHAILVILGSNATLLITCL